MHRLRQLLLLRPGTFDLDEALKSVVVDVPGGDDPRDVAAAVEGCPVDAISIIEDDD